jgi:TonB family protein
VRTVIIGAVFFFAVTIVALGQDSAEPRLISAGLPEYPALARQARIQGGVKVEFVLNASGEPISVTAISGHPLLRGAAEENVKTWRFELPKDASRLEGKYTTTFNFKITAASEDRPYDNPRLTVVLDSFRNVEVTTDTPPSKFAHDCPSPDQIQPPKAIDEGDYVELSRSGCLGTCPIYDVKVFANGDVDWNGRMFVEAKGERHSNIGPAAAHVLLEQFLSPNFWALCGGYDAAVTDNPTIQTTVQIGGRSKTVSNYAESAPEWVESFEKSVDAAAETHVWRHGASATEPLSDILTDLYLPKPGVTALMKAAGDGDIGAIKSAIESGAAIDETDSSGWTALMYAAAGSQSEAIMLLLAAGANPNHKSLAGDTPLMAAAISGDFDEDLFHAGADVNAQNSAGVTALMILASRAESEDVADALKAGADPFLKDNEGRTALDYLRLANCWKSPIRVEWQTFETGDKCNQLDKDDVEKVEALLKAAKRSTKR